jgi:hypothetical protein
MNNLRKPTAAVGQHAPAMTEIISEQDVRDLLSDAATAHRESSRRSQTSKMHVPVAEIIERIQDTKHVGSSDQDPEAYAGA